MYLDWGFKSSPFNTSPLPPNDTGVDLLVGRDHNVTSIMQRIKSGRKACTIEGLNGVGKTSVVNVSSYKLLKAHFENENQALYIPCDKIFQLRDDQSTDDFIDDVFLAIAQTLINKSEEIKRHGQFLRTNAMDRWLNNAQDISYTAGAWLISGGRTEATNSGKGFERSGFRVQVRQWLHQIFPSDSEGAVICVIDNLEILQSSKSAKQKVENLRDEIFNIPGVRWVLCGSLGIVRGVVTSPRLDGYVYDPIEIREIADHHCRDIITSRVETYKAGKKEPYLPITVDSFEKLYEILNGNIRSALARADNFCQWIAGEHLPSSEKEKNDVFDQWLNNQAQKYYDSAKGYLRPKAIEIFKTACKKGIFSISDFEEFGFDKPETFRPHVKYLLDAEIIVSSEDQSDKRRRTIQVTPKGWLVHYLFRIQSLD